MARTVQDRALLVGVIRLPAAGCAPAEVPTVRRVLKRLAASLAAFAVPAIAVIVDFGAKWR